ncbi:hypothetical protein [Phenylobacterium sp.]|jgi:hypothetical protein|uniref:hypothetical protein n=1 Tax=Phenylobacterium sp. TaxID=1871053 RepID=UPI002E327A64|nr:hypothetical protein [Phenylobacterium sp.]HEX2562159.1 hypothetical protein [Phenylobacterium sp.]
MMRLALVLVALACAGSAAAEPVQDRYGPPRKAAAPQARPYEGRLLGWSGKAAPTAPQAAPVQIAARPEPRPVAAPQPPPRAQPMSSWSHDPLPQSLYDGPAPAPAAAPPPPAPRLAQAPPPAPQRGAAPSRLYSLHREYGMAPDTVPATSAQTNYVLIGPPDAPAETEAEEDEAPARKPSIDARLF